MSPTTIALMVGVGLGAGVVGGLFGIGGGLIIVPALMLGWGFDQKTATGTSLLAQVLPVAILAVIAYYQRGEVKTSSGLAIAAGLVFGTLIGAKLAAPLSPADMKRIYGVFLVAVGLYFLLFGGTVRPKPLADPASPAVARKV